MGRVTPDAERPEPIGQTVGNYRILRKLSVGGMGTVYYAEHTLIGRSAAVKVLHPELTGSKEIVNRFFNEAKATTSIKHPGIVEVFDYGFLPTGDGYIVMEFLEGMSLARRLKNKGRYDEGEAAMLVRGVCSALAAAHAKGIVHRDLKPDNIFLVDDDEAPIGVRPKVLDFGIAKLTDVGLAGEGTKTGAVMGTPTYMSPEQCRGTGQVDHRSDLYSLGCILYELCCGCPPFTQLGAGELIGAHQHLKPSPPSKHDSTISTEMEGLILNLLDKDPTRRVQTAPDLGRHLAKIATRHGHQISMTTATPVPGPLPVTAAHDDAATSRTELAPDLDGHDNIATQPTTLSRGAAQSIATTAPNRSLVWKVVPAVAVIGAVAIAFVTINAMTGTTADAPAPAPHVQPAAPPPPPPPAEVKAAEPAPVEAKPLAASPAEPVTVEPTEVKAAEPSPVEAKPVAASPAEPVTVEPTPTEPKLPQPKPRAKRQPKPAATPTPVKPADPVKPKSVGPLESDL